jgi:Mrp family chromosome partitioning ATPase
VAFNIARAFAEASYRTAIIVSAEDASTLTRRLGAKVAPTEALRALASSGVNGAVKNLNSIVIGRGCSPQIGSPNVMKAFIAELKEKYDVVVVQAGPIPSDSAALQFAKVADGVVLAFKMGRKPSRSDRDTLTKLERVSANILGVVAVTEEVEHGIQSTMPRIDVTIPRLEPKETAAAGR